MPGERVLNLGNKLSKKHSKQPSKGIKPKRPIKLSKVIKAVLSANPNLEERRNSRHKPLDLLVLLILNQSTTDALSDRAFINLKAHYSSYEELRLQNNCKRLAEVIGICGLAPTKAGYILNLINFLHQHYDLDPNMPFLEPLSDAEALEVLTSVKGIGIKSASCMLMFACGRGTLPIDTHLYRILRRIGGIIPATTGVEAAHRLLQPVWNGHEAYVGHLGLIELGRTVCKANRPKCSECYLLNLCEHGKTLNSSNI